MLKIKSDEVEKAIQEVADQYIVPRFCNLKAGDIHFKGEDDPYTIADKEAESALSERLLALLPTSKVVGEESFASDSGLLRHFSGDSPVWIVDPVDGTKAFIAGEPVYGVIVALTEQNQTIAAWLYDPTSREFITAEKGAGAYYQGRRLNVLPPATIAQMSGVVGSRIVDAFHACAETMPAEKPTFHRMLSACHDYARLVVGEPHFSRRTTQAHFHTWLNTCTPWDCAAGILIHGEAGGHTAHWNGEPFQPSHYQRGILSAPDRDSWNALRGWIAKFCVMPE